MSEPAVKRPMIDLDEFERRLRRPTPAAAHSHEDPLAELARLVGGGQEDPFKTVFEQDRRLPRGPRLTSGPVGTSRAVPVEPPMHDEFAAEDYAADDQHLHGTIHPQTYADQNYAQETYADPQPAMTAVQPAYQAAPAEAQDYEWSEVEAPVPPRRQMTVDAPRSRRPLYATVAIIMAGITGIGVAFAYKSKSGPHELATIKAMTGPTKVQPDSPGGADVANQDASILDKTPQPTPTGLVDHQERPVDLAHQPAGAMAPRTIMADAAGTMGAASVPVPPPPAGPQGAGQQNIQSYGIGALIEPKKVKTVSVRSDGTVLPNDTPPQMQQSAPAAPSMQAPHPAAPGTLGAATPKAATPKSTARVVTTPKPESIEQQIADDNNGAPTATAPAAPTPAKAKPAPAKPMKLAETEATDSIPDGADTAHVSSGTFAVQLAAPTSEQEAHDMTNKLASKFGSELGGHHLTYHRAKVNDKTVFRVRAAGLSQKEAAGLCQKLQTSGGSCFVAKD